MSESRVTAAESDAFDECPDCGAFYVAGRAHTCSDGATHRGGPRTRDHREWRRSEDDGDPDGTVYVMNPGGDPKAYHTEDEDGDGPASQCAKRANAAGREWTETTRADAQARRCYPCSMCHDDVPSAPEGGA